MAEAARERVAILGGGVGGMVTAYCLTSSPELREKFDVTVHQMGWRLGGKGASGRNRAHHDRIEEHGLHIWFGFYDNAFSVMRHCYEELARVAPRPAACPIRTFDEAFAPNPVIGLYELWGGAWVSHRFPLPEKPSLLHPQLGEAGPLPSLWHILAAAIGWALETWERVEKGLGPDRPRFPHDAVRRFVHLADRIDVELDRFDDGLHERLADWIQKTAGRLGTFSRVHLALRGPIRFLKRMVLRPLVAFKDELGKYLLAGHSDNATLRVFFTTFDTFLSTLVGVVEEDLIGRGFMAVDDQELSMFLAKHGANDFTLDLPHSPFLRGWYDAAFAFECSGTRPVPNLAAGSGIHGILRLIATYRGHVAYKMQAGMGDTIFGPLYEVLKHRGVTFEFFHEATKLVLDDDGCHDHAVTTIEMTRQAEVSAGAAYEPLIDVHDLPCWPSEPDWDQLVDGAALRAAGVNFEYGGSAPGAATFTLHRGTDFDRVVLAIPPAAQESLCAPLIAASPAYAAMVAHTTSVMTQAAQIWTTPTLGALGSPFGNEAIATSFVEPIDTYCDMSHLLARETWGQHGPEGLAYLCGVMLDQPDQATADHEVARAVEDLLGHHGTDLWPDARGTRGGFDWGLLHAPGRGVAPAHRLAAQYLRANVVPTERYVLTPAGSTRFRLAPGSLADADPAGPDHCPNLYLAGDWTLNGINGGCVEAATMSGMQASRAISGFPNVITGEDDRWLAGIEQ